jgi:DNA-binding NarL/FixJ family response regulator
LVAAVRVVIADDERLLRAGLGVLLQADGRIDVVAEAADGAEAVEAVRVHEPDVLLLDVQMPGLGGLDILGEVLGLARPPAVAILTTFDLDDYVATALELGAAGFLLKDAEPDRLVRAVLDLAAGGAVLDPPPGVRCISVRCWTGCRLENVRCSGCWRSAGRTRRSRPSWGSPRRR